MVNFPFRKGRREGKGIEKKIKGKGRRKGICWRRFFLP
jgi:hypothetical protein